MVRHRPGPGSYPALDRSIVRPHQPPIRSSAYVCARPNVDGVHEKFGWTGHAGHHLRPRTLFSLLGVAKKVFATRGALGSVAQGLSSPRFTQTAESSKSIGLPAPPLFRRFRCGFPPGSTARLLEGISDTEVSPRAAVGSCAIPGSSERIGQSSGELWARSATMRDSPFGPSMQVSRVF